MRPEPFAFHVVEGAVLEASGSKCRQGIRLCHLVTAPSHRSLDLLLKATRGVTIAVVSSCQRKRRQPGLATDDPAFVGRHQLVRGIQGSQVHFDLVCGAGENGRAAAGTEKPPGIVACFTIDRHSILRENRGSVKKGPMMLAAVETVTKADPVWGTRRHNSDAAAQATARESVHAASPPKSSGRKIYNERHCHCNCPLRAGTPRSSLAAIVIITSTRYTLKVSFGAISSRRARRHGAGQGEGDNDRR